ncbi:MAG: 50S ribosomal protein L4 [Candidatus Kerfeldbacteria bacterium]|nr:50S ribosomal protein L4 [Candidatus Kerfeldbacteria bacterium]
MSSIKVYNQQAQPVGDVELDAKVFGLKPNRGLIEQAIVTILANRRPVLAHTKTKGEVRGGGRKPWRQKGTGRARHGSIRSPQWKGGGIIHGPRKNRNYAMKMNVVAKRKALLMSLSDKAQAERIMVLDVYDAAKPKTKDFALFLSKLPIKGKTSLVIAPATNMNLIRSGRNIPGVSIIRADSLNVYDVVNAQRLLVLKDALPVITKTYVK